jgi:hypothetical protein
MQYLLLVSMFFIVMIKKLKTLIRVNIEIHVSKPKYRTNKNGICFKKLIERKLLCENIICTVRVCTTLRSGKYKNDSYFSLFLMD